MGRPITGGNYLEVLIIPWRLTKKCDVCDRSGVVKGGKCQCQKLSMGTLAWEFWEVQENKTGPKQKQQKKNHD